MSTRRVVVTGLGAETSIGRGKEGFWSGLTEARNGIHRLKNLDTSNLPVNFGGEITDFDPLTLVSAKEARHIDRFVLLALSSTQQAVDDSGLELDKADRMRVGCIWASGIGGLEGIEANHRAALERGPRRINPFFIPKIMINAGAGQIAIRFGIQGPNYAVVSACASAKHAIGLSYKTIKYGDADVMITGGSEASVTMLGIGGFAALKALSTRLDDPETASRPFNIDRDGFVIGEGAGALIFEEYEHARARGAHIYAEVVGFGQTDDGHHISAPLEDGRMAVEAIRQALRESGISTDAVNYVNAHGTSTPRNDVMETRALHEVFGDHAKRLAVSSTKSQIGHLLGASGAAEAVVLALAVERQVAPPTINSINPDPECDLDYVPNEAREQKINYALSNSFGFGGHNACVIFGRV